jgi:hypothetical protein
VDVLKLIHEGRFEIEKVSVLPSGSDAVGRNLYAVPTVAVVLGVPEIVGGRFVEIVNAGSEAEEVPSVTLIRMFDQVPATLGTPSMRPEYLLNVIHAGLFTMLNRSALLAVSGSLAVGVKR